jgi:hypothetical protein
MDGEERTREYSQIAAALDVAHDRARRAYSDRNTAAFMAVFHHDLEYVQLDGRTITRDQLARDVHTQLSRMYAASSEYHRTDLTVASQTAATEAIVQRARFTVGAFGLLRREWTVVRRANYHWLRTASGWYIRRVEILAEEILLTRTWLAIQ